MKNGKPEVCDIVRWSGLDGRDTHWRVKFHKKKIYHELPDTKVPPEDTVERIIYDICVESYMSDQYRQEELGLPCNRKFAYVVCTLEEATHVSLTGVCGAIAPIEECEFIECVNWTPERIDEERRNAVSEFWLREFRFLPHWEWE